MPSSPPPSTLSAKLSSFKWPERASYFTDSSANPDDSTRDLETSQTSSSVAFRHWSTSARPVFDRRKSSVQFTSDSLRRGSTGKTAFPQSHRKSSPPPKEIYSKGIAFDTFDNQDASDLSFTLTYKHRDYVHSRRSRTWLCGTDQNDYSDNALQWLLDDLIDDGDEIICLKVVEKDSETATKGLIEQQYRREAQALLDSVIARNTKTKNNEAERAISLIVELAVGKVQETIQRMIQIYEPAALVVGTRGRDLGVLQGLLPGSVSKYCLQQSPIPVVVVRPPEKLMESKEERQSNPSRGFSYSHILEQTGGRHVLDRTNQLGNIGKVPDNMQKGKAVVTKEIEMSMPMETVHEGELLVNSRSGMDGHTFGQALGSPTEPVGSTTDAVDGRPDPLAFDDSEVVMKSPVLGKLESPALSDVDEEYEEKKKAKFESQPGRSVGAVVDDELPQPTTKNS